MGGWAVYYAVNESYRAAIGRDYIRSRDVDVGFHVDMDWSREELNSSIFSSFLRRMERLGFQSQSFRLYRDFDESLKPLSLEEAEGKTAFEILKLYVDPLVDQIHPLMSKVFGFTPVDEPLLEVAFREGLFKVVSFDGLQVRVLITQLLLATKLNSVLIRTQGHKRVKDLADIYSLAWHSGLSLAEIKASLKLLVSYTRTLSVFRSINVDESNEVSRILGVEQNEVRRVLRELVR